MDLILECRSLKFGYGEFGHGNSRILDDVSLGIEPGLFYAILGKNGSGKTTLLHCMNAILKPTAGSILIDNQPIATMSQREIARNISFVPQEHMDTFPFKVLDVVVMGRAPFLKMTAIPGEQDKKLAMDALDLLSSAHLANCSFNKISGGERQIALLAMALVQAGRVMLLDEPTNHLDFHNQYHLLLQIKQLCISRKISVVASMHDPNMAMLFADRVIMLKNGRIIARGRVKETMTAENLDILYETKTMKVKTMGQRYFFLPRSAMAGLDLGLETESGLEPEVESEPKLKTELDGKG